MTNQERTNLYRSMTAENKKAFDLLHTREQVNVLQVLHAAIVESESPAVTEKRRHRREVYAAFACGVAGATIGQLGCYVLRVWGWL